MGEQGTKPDPPIKEEKTLMRNNNGVTFAVVIPQSFFMYDDTPRKAHVAVRGFMCVLFWVCMPDTIPIFYEPEDVRHLWYKD